MTSMPAAAAETDVAAIRKRLGLSQAEFAMRYGLTRDVVRAWESGRRQKPQGGARVLLILIDRAPDEIAAILRTCA